MGVHGLWELLAPVGRRVSVDTLTGKKLAIDASIWMVQFMKAMRDEKGEMVRNAHLIGFFRRICKLLYLKTKPVFVFDGGTPALKRRTVIARRRQRENAQAKIRKTAEKLLLNQLKATRLKELAKDLENQRKLQKNQSKGKKKVISEETGALDDSGVMPDDKENLEETSVAYIATEEARRSDRNASSSSAAFPGEAVDDEDITLPTINGNIDPAVFAALPPEIQCELLVHQKNNDKGKKILYDNQNQVNLTSNDTGSNDALSKSCDYIKLDEMLAASIAAEEDGCSINHASASAASIPLVEEDSDEDEEMILPAIDGNIDPAVLASLPPSMQLDLLVQMRERLMAENRQKYQEVKKAPEKFSELQIKAYLKTVAFRREIDDVQKAAAGRGVGGVQTSRIASEANREFIFSSSFTGDKQELASARVERNGDKQQQTPSKQSSLDVINNIALVNKASSSTKGPDELRRDFDSDVETFRDERGCLRVSRVRAMGIRMTRDLQRNLDLMKEAEDERTNINRIRDVDSMLNLINSVNPERHSRNNKIAETMHNSGSESEPLNEQNKRTMLKDGNAIEISFEDNCESKSVEDDDSDIFASLVADNPVLNFCANNTPQKTRSSDSFSDGDWEDGSIEGTDNTSLENVNTEVNNTPRHAKEDNVSDESEMEWEEGPTSAPKIMSSCPDETEKNISVGDLEEEANLQEAIRRSLLDPCGMRSNHGLSNNKSKDFELNVHDRSVLIGEDSNMDGIDPLRENHSLVNESNDASADEANKVDTLYVVSDSHVTDSLESQLKTSAVGKRISASKSDDGLTSPDETRHDLTLTCTEAVRDELKENHLVEGQFLDTSNHGDQHPCRAKNLVEGSSLGAGEFFEGDSDSILVANKKTDSEMKLSTLVDDYKKDPDAEDSIGVVTEKSGTEAEPSIRVDTEKNEPEAEPSMNTEENYLKTKLFSLAVGRSDPSVRVVEADTMFTNNAEEKSPTERADFSNFSVRELNNHESAAMGMERLQELTESTLEDEMLVLDREYSNLGDEQRKLERNAESVSGEMFAECQELLQIFGLPYIIAPMEAEAQCAYMELTNLVDGVVTDDSDVFLFGARSVYKNIFDDRKYVETYFMQDVEKELGLSREKLIRMALLLGSDYTEGISGIGIVNAIEVVTAFPENDGLQKFREWIESPDPTIFGKLDVNSGSNVRKRGPKGFDNDGNCAASCGERVSEFENSSQAEESEQSVDHSKNIKKTFMNKHRNVSKNWHIPSTFPSEAVISAYECPQVDRSTEPFSWGKPDRLVLRKFCWDKFGWGSEKSDNLLLPVLKEYEKRETQLRLEAFYSFNERFAKIRSKRINKAVKGITNSQSSELVNDAAEALPKSRKKRRVSHSDGGNEDLEKAMNGEEETEAGSQNMETEKIAPKQSRKRRPTKKLAGEHSTCEVVHGKGQDQNCSVGRGRGRQSAKLCDTKSCDKIGGHDKIDVNAEKLKWSQEVRRSTRSRKPVDYSLNDPETEDMDKTMSDEDYLTEQAMQLDLFGAGGMTENVSACLDNKKQHKSGDLPSEGFCSDNLDRGGGFCIDEGEMDQSSVRQNEDPFTEAASKDYLATGGGFCVDESDAGENQNAVQNPMSVEEDAGSSPLYESVEKVDPDVDSTDPFSSPGKTLNGGRKDTVVSELNQTAASDDNSKMDEPQQDNLDNDTVNVSLGVLSAMPFLKRKRRKS